MSKRSYKGALSHEAAIDIMRADVGRQFDPGAVRALRGADETRAPSLRQRVVVESQAADRAAGTRPDRLRSVGRSHRSAHAPAVRRHRQQDSRRARSVRDRVADRRSTSTSSSTSTTRTVTCRATRCCASSPVRCASSRVDRHHRPLCRRRIRHLLPHTPADEAAELAERIRGTVSPRRHAAARAIRSRSPSRSRWAWSARARAHGLRRALRGRGPGALRSEAPRPRHGRRSRPKPSEASQRADDQPEAVRRPRREMHASCVCSRRRWRADRTSCRSSARPASASRRSFVAWPAKCGCAPARSSSGAASRPTRSRRTRRGPRVIAAIHQLGVVAPQEWRELPRLVPVARRRRRTSRAATSTRCSTRSSPYLRLAAAARPIVIVLDDMQWSDSATWDVLEHVMTQLEHERILICLTMRAEETRGESIERRNRLIRDERFHEIPLSRLTEAEIQQWLAGVFGGDASRELLAYSASLLGRQSAARDAARAHAARRRRGALRARALGAALGARRRPSRRRSRGSWTVGSSVCRRTHAASSTPPRSSAACSTSISRSPRAPAPRTKCSTRSTKASRTPSSSRRTRRRAASSRSRTACSSTPFVARSIRDGWRAFTSASPSAMEERTPDNVGRDRDSLRSRRHSAEGVPSRDGRRRRRARVYAHAEARRFFEIAERAASDPVERAQRAPPAGRSRRDRRSLRADRRVVRSRAGRPRRSRRRPRDSRAAPHARAHARAAGTAGERDDRRVPRAARQGARAWRSLGRSGACST